MLSDLFIRLRALLRRRVVEAELDDELRFHRERQLEHYARAGLSPDQARRRLALEFGGLDQTREACRDARGISAVEHLVRDSRYALRSLRKTPGFTISAVLTLGLGLGANTAIFSVVYGVLLKPLPYADASRVLVLRETTPKVGAVSVSYPDFLDWRAQSRAFSALAMVCDLSVDLGGVSQPESLDAEAVSSNYLPLLGVQPLLGRGLAADEDQPGAAPVVLLSYALWQTHFGGDPAVLGRTIRLDDRPATVVGVLPRDFGSVAATSLIEPIGTWLTGNHEAMDRGNRGDTVVVGRLAPSATVDGARSEMDGIAARLAQAYPRSNAGFGVSLAPIRNVLIGDVQPALLVLFGAVLCVLLTACANVANLSLIRGAGRTREIALRAAIGAGRRRIVLQLLVESFVLAALGGLAGLVFAVGGLHGLAWLMPSGALGGARVALNGAALAFTGAIVLASTVAFGLAPAVQAARADVATDLKDGGRTASGGRRQQRWRAVLAVAEISLALVLLVGAGLMLRSLSRLLSVDPGVRTDHVLTTHVSLQSTRYDAPAAQRQFWNELLEKTSALPGVTSAALGTGVPLTDDHSRSDISIDRIDFAEGALPHPDVHLVSPGYVRTLGVRLLRGRAFAAIDTDGAPHVGLINRSIADRFFAKIDPIGGRFAFGRVESGKAPAWITIVGVVDDTRLYGLDNPARLEVYLPFDQAVPSGATLVLRTAGDPAALTPALRGIVASIDPNQPISDTATMDELLGASMSTRRVTLVLLLLFSGLALTLAAIGVYGVLAYAVAQRTNELGIRLALGARRRDVLQTVLGQGLAIAAAGVVCGGAAALGLTRLMSGLLFSVTAADPITFAAVSAGVTLVAVAACAIPGWRAAHVDPLTALRQP